MTQLSYVYVRGKRLTAAGRCLQAKQRSEQTAWRNKPEEKLAKGGELICGTCYSGFMTGLSEGPTIDGL